MLFLQSDVTLEALVTNATEGLRRASKGERRRDERLLTDAFRDRATVERCWIFLTQAVATRAAEAAGDPAMHSAARRLVEKHFPLTPDDKKVLTFAPSAAKAGYWSTEFVLTHHAFALLVGDKQVARLAQFKGFEPFPDLVMLEHSWSHAESDYLDLLDLGVLRGVEMRTDARAA
jgi:hypothetical protein